MKRLSVYVRGDKDNGMGHVARQLVLAAALHERGVRVSFITHRNTVGCQRLIDEGRYHVQAVTGESALSAALAGQDADSLLIDTEHGPSRRLLAEVRPYYDNLIVVAGHGFTLQDYPAVVEYADLELYQGLDVMPGDKAIGGTRHILIDARFAACKPCADGPIVLVLGGADPHHMTGPIAQALSGIGRTVLAVVGPAASDPFAEIKPLNTVVVQSPPNLLEHLNGAALMVGAFGTVAWEACAAGVVPIMYGWSPNHVATADELHRRGVGFSLGMWDTFNATSLRATVELALSPAATWQSASVAARGLVDGQGARRVAERIAGLLGC